MYMCICVCSDSEIRYIYVAHPAESSRVFTYLLMYVCAKTPDIYDSYTLSMYILIRQQVIYFTDVD